MFGSDAYGKVSLSGAGRGRQRPGNESRTEFLKRQHREREEREQKRIREKSATCIQSVFRGWRSRRVEDAGHRALFEKRCSDLAKVEHLLKPEQRAAFVFRALVPVLRLLVFFFSAREDGARLTKVVEMVRFSASQAAPVNFLRLALSSNDAERRSFLVLLERLFAALLRMGEVREAAQLLQLLHRALSTEGDAGPEAERLRGAALSQLLRRTQLLPALSREALLVDAGGAAGPPELELILACCCGLEASGAGAQQMQLAAYLLSAPLLCEQLQGLQRSHLRARECLLRIARLATPAPKHDEDAAGLVRALSEDVRGSSRWAWLLGNFMVLALASLDCSGDAELVGERCDVVRTMLAWICWVKARAPAAVRAGAFPERLATLQGPNFARALLANVDAGDSKRLLPAVLELYFPVGGTAEQDCPEALQSLAFCTPIVERLVPYVSALARSPSIAAALKELGADFGTSGSSTQFSTLQAMQLRAFCAVYTVQLQSLYDAEFFGAANPLGAAEVSRLVPFLNRLAYCFVTQWPDRSALTPFGGFLRSSLTSLVCALYHRQLRMPILEGSGAQAAPWWTVPEARALLDKAPVVDLGLDEAPAAEEDGEGEDDAQGMDVDEDGAAVVASSAATAAAQREAQRRKARLGGDSYAREVLEAVLEEVPHVLPFQDRVALLHNVILADQDSRDQMRADWARATLPQHRIRRASLVEDGFTAFAGLNDEDSLRAVFKVEFIGPDGEPESGIDGGGLFKEFMIHICRTVFDPEFGLFAATDDWTLYPSPTAFRSHANASELYRFLGKVVGKAIYEMLLLEPQFSRVFLNRLLGHTNEIDDVAALDRELHRGMRRLKEHGNVEEFGLTFSIAGGTTEEVDLIPNGRNIAVTRESLTHYLHVVSNFRTNLQIQKHTAAFVQGLQCIIPLTWLKMFDPYELNTLVSGSSSGFDVADLRENTVYGGGYHENSPVIQWLWTLLKDHLDVQDMGRFLMFTTSCSRPPLLGFRTLYPKFCIHRVPEPDRLPTASTCANLFKLPQYRSFEDLKAKVTQAIRAECGFDLS